MSRFAPPKAKRPVNLQVLMPSAKATMTTTTNTMPTTASLKMNTTTNSMMTSTCRTCKRWGLPCPFCVKSALHLSPQEFDWSDEELDGNRQKAREQQKKADSNITATINTTTTAAHTDVDCLLNTETAPISSSAKPLVIHVLCHKTRSTHITFIVQGQDKRRREENQKECSVH